MSRGPGRIRRAVDAALAANPDNAFSTDELCRIVYGLDDDFNATQKKHRVAVLRAMKQRANTNSMAAEHPGAQRVFFSPDNVLSHAMARIKSVMLHRKGDDDLKAKLRKGELYQRVMDDGKP